MKSLQKEQNSTNLLLCPPICRNSWITPKWFNSLDTNSIRNSNLEQFELHSRDFSRKTDWTFLKTNLLSWVISIIPSYYVVVFSNRKSRNSSQFGDLKRLTVTFSSKSTIGKINSTQFDSKQVSWASLTAVSVFKRFRDLN